MSAPLPSAFLPGSPGPLEILLILIAILLLFGPRRLPEIARAIGRALDQLRRASQDFRDHIMQIDQCDADDPSPAETRTEGDGPTAPEQGEDAAGRSETPGSLPAPGPRTEGRDEKRDLAG
jgi:TatA/E family protein of Tat protein translocase